MASADKAPPPVEKASMSANQGNTTPTATTPSDRTTDFTAVDASKEEYSGGTLLVVAYGAIWVILMAWIFLLWRKQAALTVRLDGLEAAIDRAAAAKGTKK